jgi:hypothetical protein
MQTEFDFTLPLGFVDKDGTLHKKGVMRLATAIDEIAPLRDPRVRTNEAYLTIILLSRVIVKLGTVSLITTDVVENLFAPDLAYLQAFYRRIHEEGTTRITVRAPNGDEFELDLADLGEAL